MSSRVQTLNIIYQNASKNFQITKRTTAADFTDLLQEAFEIAERIIGFQDPEGKFYELSELFETDTRPDHLFLITDFNLSKFTDHLNILDNQHNVSALEHETFPIRFITSFEEYKKVLRKGDDDREKKINVFLIFNNLAEARTYMENSIASVFDFDQKDMNISFTVVDENLTSDAYSIFTELPCLAVFVRRKKILELSLDCPSGFIQKLIHKVLARYEEVVISDRSHDVTPMKDLNKNKRMLDTSMEKDFQKISAPFSKPGLSENMITTSSHEEIDQRANKLMLEVLEKVLSLKLIVNKEYMLLKELIDSRDEGLRNILKEYFLEEIGLSELGPKLKKFLNNDQTHGPEPLSQNVEKEDSSKDIMQIMKLVRKIAEENGPDAFNLINQLIIENDPLIESALDIFMDDDDEVELRDTLKRIVERKRDKLEAIQREAKKGINPGVAATSKLDNNVPNLGSSSRNEKEKKNAPNAPNKGKKKEDPVKKDNKAEPEKREEKSKKSTNDREKATDSPKKLQKSASSVMDIQNLEDTLVKYSDEFEDEEYGMIQFLIEAEDSAILDFQRMHRKNIITLEKAVEGIKTYSQSKFQERLAHRFTEKELNSMKKNRNQGTYSTIFKDFRYNHNITDLIKRLEIEISQPMMASSTLNTVPLVPHNSEVTSPNIETKSQEKLVSKKEIGKSKEKPKNDCSLDLKKEHSDRTFKFFLKSKNDPLESSHYSMHSIALVATFDTFERPVEVSDALSDFYIKQKELDMNEMEKTFARMKKVGLEKSFLTKDDFKKLDILYENNDFFLHALLFQYKTTKNLTKIKNELRELLDIETADLEMVSSPLTKSKLRKYHNFKHLIKTLLDTGRIGEKKFKLYNYLFVKEDLSILSAYEVYLINKNWEEFVENLFIIERLTPKRTHLKIEEIELFDFYIQEQLKILFTLRQKLSSNNLDTLEKAVRKGDNKLLGFYEKLKKNAISLKEFIAHIQDHSKRKYSEEIKEINSLRETHQHKLNKEKQLELIKLLKEQKYINSVHNLNLLYEMVNEQSEEINRAFENYQKHKNKKEIAENLTKIYEESTRKNFKEIIRAHALRKNWLKDQVKKVAESIDSGNEALLGAYEFYSTEINEESEEELLDTVGRFIKLFQ